MSDIIDYRYLSRASVPNNNNHTHLCCLVTTHDFTRMSNNVFYYTVSNFFYQL